jgi:parallel beta helix pectate lyase-like protein
MRKHESIMKVFASVMIFIAAFVAQSAVYYVNPEKGVDKSENGKTLKTPWKTINYAYANFEPGKEGDNDVIFLAKGVYNEQAEIVATKRKDMYKMRNMMKIERRLIIRGAKGAVIDAESKRDNCLKINHSFVNIEGVELRNAQKGGIEISAPKRTPYVKNIIVKNCIVRNSFSGIIMSRTENVTIKECQLIDNKTGINVTLKSTNMLLQNILLHPTQKDKVVNGFNLWNGTSGVIKNCTLYGAPDRADGTAIRIGPKYGSCNIIVENSIIVGWRNGVTIKPNDGKSSIKITNSNVWRVKHPYGGGAEAGKDCISEDPQFVKPSAGDFNMKAESHCLGLGVQK